MAEDWQARMARLAAREVRLGEVVDAATSLLSPVV